MLLVIFYEDIQSQIFYLQLQLSNYKEGVVGLFKIVGWAVCCLLPHYGPKVLGRCWGPFVEAQQTEEPNNEGHKELTG